MNNNITIEDKDARFVIKRRGEKVLFQEDKIKKSGNKGYGKHQCC